MSAELIAKIRKILAKTTEAGCTPGEAEIAMGTVTRLLDKHNLTMAQVLDATKPSDEVYCDEFTFTTGRWSAIHNLAYGIVVEFCHVHGYFTYSKGNQRKVKHLYLFGLRDNVETARFMFTSLLANFDHLWDYYRARTCADVKDKFSFMSGVAAGFSAKMRAERESFAIEEDDAQHLQSGSTALVLQSVAERTKKAYKTRYPDMKNVNINYQVQDRSSEVRADGYRVGQRLTLRRNLEK